MPKPQVFETASIFFCDIVSFTTICSDSTAHQIIEFLNDLYHMFDDRIDNFDVYKVLTTYPMLRYFLYCQALAPNPLSQTQIMKFKDPTGRGLGLSLKSCRPDLGHFSLINLKAIFKSYLGLDTISPRTSFILKIAKFYSCTIRLRLSVTRIWWPLVFQSPTASTTQWS